MHLYMYDLSNGQLQHLSCVSICSPRSTPHAAALRPSWASWGLKCDASLVYGNSSEVCHQVIFKCGDKVTTVETPDVRQSWPRPALPLPSASKLDYFLLLILIYSEIINCVFNLSHCCVAFCLWLNCEPAGPWQVLQWGCYKRQWV